MKGCKRKLARMIGLFWLPVIVTSLLMAPLPVSASAPADRQQTEEDSQIVTFPDGNLEAAIRLAINKLSGDIYQSDLLIIESLSASGRRIENLSGIQYCTNIKELNLDGNRINDLSPLTSLTSLTYLALGCNQVNDISSLPSLINLTNLKLGYNQISDISPLASLNNLASLTLNNNQITDISALASLSNLTSLDLADNQIGDTSPLASLSALKALNLRLNKISDISPLTALTNLTGLDLGYNQIKNLSPLAPLVNLTHLTLRCNQINELSTIASLSDLTYLDLGFNQIGDISSIASLDNLTELYLGKNQITDISPLSSLYRLTELVLRDNQINDISSLAALTNLAKLDLIDNSISDISSLVANQGIGSHDYVGIAQNYLDLSEDSPTLDDIRALINRGTNVEYYPQNDSNEKAPIVLSVSRNSGSQGEDWIFVWIMGVNFEEVTDVNFGTGITVKSFDVSSTTHISAYLRIDTAAPIGARDVSVTTTCGTGILSGGFMVDTIPVVKSAVPDNVTPGETNVFIVITGVNFAGAMAVSFGEGIVVNSFNVDNPTQITANIDVLQTAPLGGRNITVSTPDGMSLHYWGFMVNATVSIEINGSPFANVIRGEDFIVRIGINQVTDLAGYDLVINYDPEVIQILTPYPGGAAGTLWITPGLIGSKVVPLDAAGFTSEGPRIFGHFSQIPVPNGASGSGYLCEVHFHVVTTIDYEQTIFLSDYGLCDIQGREIPAIAVDGSIQVVPLKGDVDGDGKVGIADIIQVELIMAGVSPEVPVADVDGDGEIGIGDVITIELMMIGVI